jgi:CRP-like cAMP-binding protein
VAESITARDQKIEMLRSVALFQACSRTELDRICSLTTERWARAGEVLTKLGEPGLEAFVIVEGAATATRRGREIARLEPGSLFGELALLDGNKRTATVTADTNMILLSLSGTEFTSLLLLAPTVARKIISELGARLRRTDELLDPMVDPGGTLGPLSV